jgi:hypothetical protein
MLTPNQPPSEIGASHRRSITSSFAKEMITYLTDNWRLVILVVLTLLAVVLFTASFIPKEIWTHTFYTGFYVVGSLAIFTVTYIWPFVLRVLDRYALNRGSKLNGDGGARFFLWASLIIFPLVAIDGLFPLPSPDALFGVSACLGLIAGCTHALAKSNKESEQVGAGDAEEAV